MQSFLSKIIAVSALLMAGSATAQVSFTLPVHPAMQSVSAAEYFFDSDPGFGAGQPVSFTSGMDVNPTFSASIGSLSKGAHRLFVRTRNSSGQWSMTNSLSFVSYSLLSALPAIVNGGQVTAAEYFVDSDPGYGAATPVALPAPGADVTISNVAVNISALSLGVHRVYFRSRNAEGRWSMSTGATFTLLVSSVTNLPQHPAGKPVSALEYFIDTDPGFGNGTIINVSPTTDLVNHNFAVDISTLSAGVHTLFVRSINGRSLTTAKTFQIGGTALALTWLHIDGRAQDALVELNWRVSDEEGCKDYVVERSNDGKTFSKIGTVICPGTGASESSYVFTDLQPLDGISYYRIQQRSRDGKGSYSQMISIRRGATGTEVRINNPVSSTLTVTRLGEAANELELFVVNASGVEVLRIPRSPALVQQLNVGHLPAGLYLLKWIAAGRMNALKFVKH